MSRRFIISPLTVISMVLFLAAGELASGTALPYVAMMAVAMLAIFATYNMLGGLGTFGGVLFAAFALNTLVISQFAKVFMFEAADLNLRAPELTIAVYAVYFLSLMVGVFLFGWIRLKLPRPLEPSSATHSGVIYVFSLVMGLAAKIYLVNLELEQPGSAGSASHAMARALAFLLPLSLVMAVDARIRKTGGRHCFGWAAFWPAIAIEFLGFSGSSRTEYVLPIFLVAVTGYFRGFKFSRRHYVAAAVLAAVLFLFVSPWYLFTRAYRRQRSLWQQITVAGQLVSDAPAYWPKVRAQLHNGVQNAKSRGEEYFSRAGAVTLNRLVLIPDDDAVIAACTHYHWGFATIKIDGQDSIPHFIEKNKPDRDGTWFRASVGGLQSSYAATAYITTSTISDAWGGFGWAGVIVVPLLLVPWVFVEYDSIFDMSRPWGTVALLGLATGFAVDGVGSLLIGVVLEIPLYILLISWFSGWLTRSIPMVGDSSHRRGAPLFQPDGTRTMAGD